MRKALISVFIVLFSTFVWADTVVVVGQPVASGGSSYTVSYEGSENQFPHYSNTTVRCYVPEGSVEGQLITVTWISDNGTADVGTNADWTHIATARGNNGSDQFCAASYYRELPSSPPEYYDIVTSDIAGSKQCISTVYSKSGGSWVVRASTVANADSATITSNSVTGYAGGALQGMFYNDSNLTVSSNPSGMTEAQTYSDLSVSAEYLVSRKHIRK